MCLRIENDTCLRWIILNAAFDAQTVVLDNSRCTVKRKEKSDLVVTPDIVCENVKDAEHLASTLALYHLCRGQVHSYKY